MAKRRAPTGGAAYGTARNMLTPCSTLPRSRPAEVRAVGDTLIERLLIVKVAAF
jgi:hypothetical protein